MITPSQIREKKISVTQGEGYDRNEVNELLADVIESYEAVCAENRELYRKMEILANRIEEYREDEDSIKTALIAAQKTASRITAEAKEKAEQSLSESAASAQQTVKDAREKADKIVGEAREYVANLTKEKTTAADEIVADAREKANAAISSAKLVAQDTIEKAKKLTEEIAGKAKAEREYHIGIASKLRDESKDFRATLVSLYETQLGRLKDMADQTDDGESARELEAQLDSLVSGMDSVALDELDNAATEQKASEEEVEPEYAEQEPEQNGDDASKETDSVDTGAHGDESNNSEEPDFELTDDVQPEFEEIEEVDINSDFSESDDEPDVESAINAFTKDEITPVDDSGLAIPVIDEEPELEPPAVSFEDFFDVDKVDPRTSETISLTAPDEDDDEDSSRFKGFFKKRK